MSPGAGLGVAAIAVIPWFSHPRLGYHPAMNVPAILFFPLLAACTGGLAPGDQPADQAALADAPALAHLAAAYPDAAVVADLFARDRVPTSAPDPSAWFDADRAAHAALPALQGGTELKVLSYNVGLLDREYLLGRASVPNLSERRARQLDLLFAEGWDVLILQELWEWSDAQAFAQAASVAGYQAWIGSESLHPYHGVGLFVRSSLVGLTNDQREVTYSAQRKLEKWPGPGLERAWLEWSFELAGSGETVVVVGTHLSPFMDFWHVRDLQARQLGLRVAALPADAIVVLGGDLNAGPYYSVDRWVNTAGEEVNGFWRNASTLPLLAHYGGLVDARVLVNPPQDVAFGDAVPVGGGPSYAETPYGASGFCAEHRGTWTATDCNGLSFSSYGGDELPSRMDHIFLRDGTGTLRVLDGGLAHAEVDPALGFELSDHYAPWVTLGVGGTAPGPEPLEPPEPDPVISD